MNETKIQAFNRKGTTHFCEACEQGAGGFGYKPGLKHTCGLSHPNISKCCELRKEVNGEDECLCPCHQETKDMTLEEIKNMPHSKDQVFHTVKAETKEVKECPICKTTDLVDGDYCLEDGIFVKPNKNIEGWREEFDRLFYNLEEIEKPFKLNQEIIKARNIIRQLFRQTLSAQRDSLLKEMLKECDRTENEGGRLLLEKYLYGK